ncbi:hypothetical protein PA3_15380 [Acinetobacter pittii]|uniref:Uncharacterized protein n=1 Tax=Acinetobacter pittii TaxID=48296 RepID=A0A4Y3J9J5_ACIPI|nr:hypothetical protein PA3_15380 [Acinetobacter pittii]
MRQNLLCLKRSIAGISGCKNKPDLLIFSNKNLSICAEHKKRLVSLLITFKLVCRSSNQVSTSAKVLRLFCHGLNLEEYFRS